MAGARVLRAQCAVCFLLIALDVPNPAQSRCSEQRKAWLNMDCSSRRVSYGCIDLQTSPVGLNTNRIAEVYKCLYAQGIDLQLQPLEEVQWWTGALSD